jgi:hypothetical protein
MVRSGTFGTNALDESGDWAASKLNRASAADVFIWTLSADEQVWRFPF